MSLCLEDHLYFILTINGEVNISLIDENNWGKSGMALLETMKNIKQIKESGWSSRLVKAATFSRFDWNAM